jgi:hypothetical protein
MAELKWAIVIWSSLMLLNNTHEFNSWYEWNLL